MNLFFRATGNGRPLVILHGLLGSSDNWATLAKFYGEYFRTIIPDQRNHGQSFHSDEFNYQVLSQDLREFIDQQVKEPVLLVGHSMGGKVAMKFALEYPDVVTKLVVADMAPKKYKVDYDLIFEAFNSVDLGSIQSRSQADKIVADKIPDFAMRQFLLKNLTREEGKYTWKANIPSIQDNIDHMGDWHPIDTPYEGPTLFVSGDKSGYVKPEDHAEIRSHFSDVIFAGINAGHWLHAEKPNEFLEITLNFLKQ